MAAKDEKQQWEATCEVGKSKFVMGVFLRIFLPTLVGVVIVFVVNVARTKQWSGSDLTLSILFAVIFSVAYTVICGIGSWQDLERQFGKPDRDIR